MSMHDDSMTCDPGLRLIAERLLSTARCAHRDFRFGDRKVFLAAILPCPKRHPSEYAEMLEALEACRCAGLLTFARADLVAAMDADMVAESEWVHPAGATFHFLVVA